MNRTKERNEINQNYQRNYDNSRVLTREVDYSAGSHPFERQSRRESFDRNADFQDRSDRNRYSQVEREDRYYDAERTMQRRPAPQQSRTRDYRYENAPSVSRNQNRVDRDRQSYQSPNRISVSAKVERDSFNDLPIGGAFDSFERTSNMYNVRENTATVAKKKMSNKIKVFIAVYFVIIATITALILINAFPQNQSAGAQTNASQTQVENLTKEQALTVVTAEGAVVLTEGSKVDYTYEKSTNFFDKICDWIENLVG